jgi:hypothetical protein
MGWWGVSDSCLDQVGGGDEGERFGSFMMFLNHARQFGFPMKYILITTDCVVIKANTSR